MTLADLTVDIVPIVRSIAGKRRNRSRDLRKQRTDLRTVIVEPGAVHEKKSAWAKLARGPVSAVLIPG
jgi:hypothetical protein